MQLKDKEEEVDRRKDGKTILRNGQGWTLLAQLGQLKKGIVVKSSAVCRQPRKVLGLTKLGTLCPACLYRDKGKQLLRLPVCFPGQQNPSKTGSTFRGISFLCP